jgi:hypothetical protein
VVEECQIRNDVRKIFSACTIDASVVVEIENEIVACFRRVKSTNWYRDAKSKKYTTFVHTLLSVHTMRNNGERYLDVWWIKPRKAVRDCMPAGVTELPYNIVPDPIKRAFRGLLGLFKHPMTEYIQSMSREQLARAQSE